MAGKKGMKAYPAELKLEAVRLFYEGGRMRAQITAALGIRDPQRIQKWLRQYRAEGAGAFAKPSGRPRKRVGVQAELERLRMEVALLKKLHSELREVQLAQRNIGCSTTIGKTSHSRLCAPSWVSREPPTMRG
jgi:transposase-like protein